MTPPTQALAAPAVVPIGRPTGDDIRNHRRGHRSSPAARRASLVLVLDGDGERQALFADIVTRAGGETVRSCSGADAIGALESHEPQAILVAGLPDGSLRGFIAWARPRHPDLAIVAVADGAQDATDLYNAGADVVATAPVDPDLLGAKLAAALRRARRTHLRAVR